MSSTAILSHDSGKLGLSLALVDLRNLETRRAVRATSPDAVMQESDCTEYDRQ
jgi:hypothetical protein